MDVIYGRMNTETLHSDESLRCIPNYCCDMMFDGFPETIAHLYLCPEDVG
jgi:hypothetical protein